MSKKKGRRKAKRSFNLDEVTTSIRQAICRDLEPLILEYSGTIPHIDKCVSAQIEALSKKLLTAEADQVVLEKRAFGSFVKVNEYIGRINTTQSFPASTARIQSGMSFMDKVHLRARALFHQILGQLDEDQWFSACKHSGGSTVGVPFVDTSVDAKSTYPLSTTVRANTRFERYLEYDVRLKLALEDHNAQASQPRYRIVPGSRATTVEKDNRKRRFICIEPTCNMFLQQGLMLLMYDRMRKFGLDVELLPTQHKLRAQIASLTGLDATIDWAHASDSAGIELLRWLVPPVWFEALNAVRSPVTEVPGYGETELNMFSTMGNATTFPLETLIFWTYAHATRLTVKRGNTLFPEWEDLKCCSVFGDDCIVPTNMAKEFMVVLEGIGFEVNIEKSFYLESDKFRESCGGDYLAGYPVRPVSLQSPTNKRISTLESWLYTLMNEFHKKYIMYFGSLAYVYDRHFFREVFRLFEKYKIKPMLVPSYFPSDAGLLDVDFLRLASAYGVEISPLRCSDQGSVSFLYKRFVYRENVQKNEHLRLWSSLKTASLGTLVPRLEYQRKRKGGYVVARGFSSCWSLAAWMAAPRNR